MSARKKKGAPAPRIPLRSEVKRARVSGGGAKVVEDLSLWSNNARIGGGITPAQIGAILREADGGSMSRLMDLGNECRQRDSHLQAVLATLEESNAGLAWQIVPPDDARAKDKRAARWAEAVLRANPYLPALIAHLAGAIFYGYAVAEIMWAKSAGKMIPTLLCPLAPRRFGFRPRDGRFVWRDDGTTLDGIDFREKHPRKFIVAQPRVNGDVANREGLVRPLVWMSVFRNWVISDWLRTAEISWKPWRIGTYKKAGTNNEDRAELESAMRRLTTDGSVTKSDAVEIDVKWPEGATSARSTHAEFTNVLGNEMSKAVLGQTETTQASTSSGYAQAKVHDAVRRDLLESRAKYIAQVLTRDMLTSLIELNFDGIRLPRFEFLTQDPIDLNSFAESLKALREAGARIPHAWVHDQTGIPKPNENEPCLGDDDGDGEDDDDGKPADKKPEPADKPEPGEGTPEGETPSEDEKPDAEPEE